MIEPVSLVEPIRGDLNNVGVSELESLRDAHKTLT